MDSVADLRRRYGGDGAASMRCPRFGDRGLTLGCGIVLARVETGSADLDGDRFAKGNSRPPGRAGPA